MSSIQPHLSHPKYRPDIDGLRALAVLSVVAFHAFPGRLKGGFTGVDVFFVISGYLISTIIFENLDNGTFSFAEFYARRIRRIFPALLLILIASYAFGWFTLLADEYKQLGKHIAAGAGFISNITLLSEQGYFDNAAETKPLLHLWSLGIEEQFYIVWPLLLWLAWKRKFNLPTIILLVAAASFYCNVAGVSTDAVAAFYSPQSRFWELLCGSLLAWATLYRPAALDAARTRLAGWLPSAGQREKADPGGTTLSNILSFSGFALLLYGFWIINKGVNFPGMWAVVPVAGTVLLIAAGPKAWINRIVLSNRVAVWFGLISFPLYLWHWPLLSFAKLVEGETPDRSIRVAEVILAVLLAWLTYKLLERPLRSATQGAIKAGVLAVLMAGVGFVGYNTYEREGLLFRFNKLAPAYKNEIEKIATAWQFRPYPRPEGAHTEKKYGFLRMGRNDSKAVLFVGDSHAEQYWNTVGELIRRAGTAQSDKPSVMFADLGFPPRMDQSLVSDASIKIVIFSYYWSYRYGSDAVNQTVRCCGAGKSGMVGTNTHPHYSPAEMDDTDNQIAALVAALKGAGKEVYFVLDNPFGEEIDPHSMMQRSWAGFAVKPAAKLPREVALGRTEPVRSRLLKIARTTKSVAIDPFVNLCDEKYCSAVSAEGELLYKDYDHLSLFASIHKVHYLNFIFE